TGLLCFVDNLFIVLCRNFNDLFHRIKELCRYISNFDNEAHTKYKNQVVYCTMLIFFKSVFQYISAIQPSLFQGPNSPNQIPIVLLEDTASVFSEVETNSSKHIHKRRKLADSREKTMGRYLFGQALDDILDKATDKKNALPEQRNPKKRFFRPSKEQPSNGNSKGKANQDAGAILKGGKGGGDILQYRCRGRFLETELTSSDDEDLSGKGRSRHVIVNKNDWLTLMKS
ncbi:unnamed protein product, partial [Ranitomeya imitator]